MNLLIEERDELLRERKLLVSVATGATWLIEALDEYDAAHAIDARHDAPAPNARAATRAALEAWTSDEASQRGEDEGG